MACPGKRNYSSTFTDGITTPRGLLVSTKVILRLSALSYRVTDSDSRVVKNYVPVRVSYSRNQVPHTLETIHPVTQLETMYPRSHTL